MKCYIIDDELHAINNIVRHIEKIPNLSIAGSSTDAIHAVGEVNRLDDIDLVFLDVDMPDLSGLQIATMIPDHIKKIFTTAHSNYAVDAFELNAVDFLVKPISLERFVKAIQKLEQKVSNSQEVKEQKKPTLFINPGMRGKVVQIVLSDIIYIEGLKNYVVIHTTDDGKHITYLTMNEIEEALKPPQFFRIHKSFIINKEKIKSVEGNRVFMTNSMQFNLGITYKEAFMQFITSATLKSRRKDKA